MTSNEIRKRFLDFFADPAHGRHMIVPSSSLIPDDPSVLLTTAGMQQFKPYYAELDPTTTIHPSIGKPVGRNAASCQKSFRTSDIDEVGDERHLTFFEMLGNFSFGGYFKKEAITWAHEFITKEMGLVIEWVSIFEGKENIGVPRDAESEAIWKSLGITDIRTQGMDDVFWGPTGSSGPCGPTTEIYCKNGAGQDIEVWNLVFNQYFYPGSREELNTGAPGKKLEPLKTPGVDTGMGLERLAMIAQGTPTIFETDLFEPLVQLVPSENLRLRRILSDHIKASVYLIADGVEPSNKERGYVLRRILRRAVFHAKNVAAEAAKTPLSEGNLGKSWDERTEKIIHSLADKVIELNPKELLNPDLENKKTFIHTLIKREEGKFVDILKSDSELTKILDKYKEGGYFSGMYVIPGGEGFRISSTYGLPLDYIKDRASECNLKVNEEEFEQERKKHQEISRAGSEAKFGGHGLYLKTGEVTIRDESEVEKVTRLHTATHLLHAGLRAVLGEEVRQDGSDITAERTRFDFRFPRKVTPEELKKVEEWVNDAVAKDLAVEWKEMSYEEATKEGALGFFREKYPPRVKVYTVYDKASGTVYSKELCGGPHVEHAGTVGRFKILKEESSSAGVRRVRAVVE